MQNIQNTSKNPPALHDPRWADANLMPPQQKDYPIWTDISASPTFADTSKWPSRGPHFVRKDFDGWCPGVRWISDAVARTPIPFNATLNIGVQPVHPFWIWDNKNFERGFWPLRLIAAEWKFCAVDPSPRFSWHRDLTHWLPGDAAHRPTVVPESPVASIPCKSNIEDRDNVHNTFVARGGQPPAGYRFLVQGEEILFGDVMLFDGEWTHEDCSSRERYKTDYHYPRARLLSAPYTAEQLRSTGLTWPCNNSNVLSTLNSPAMRALCKDISDVLLERSADQIAPGHNPAKFTNAQVGVADGWRLLTLAEISERERTADLCRNLGTGISMWLATHEWSKQLDFWGNVSSSLYRTKKPVGYFLPPTDKSSGCGPCEGLDKNPLRFPFTDRTGCKVVCEVGPDGKQTFNTPAGTLVFPSATVEDGEKTRLVTTILKQAGELDELRVENARLSKDNKRLYADWAERAKRADAELAQVRRDKQAETNRAEGYRLETIRLHGQNEELGGRLERFNEEAWQF